MLDLVAGCMAARMEGEGVLDLNHMEEAIGSTCQLFMAVHCNLELVSFSFVSQLQCKSLHGGCAGLEPHGGGHRLHLPALHGRPLQPGAGERCSFSIACIAKQ